MGKGLAKEAADRFDWLPFFLADHIRRHGSEPAAFSPDRIVCFPTKYEWALPASLSLIEANAEILKRIWSPRPTFPEAGGTLYLPRLGCGLGGLDWTDVKPVLEKHLGETFVVVTEPKKQ